MKAIIIDDEPLARMMIREYLQGHPDITVMQECGDGFEGMKAIQEHNPDLVFLDVQMPKITGFEMLELVENSPAIIFTTAFDAYAIKAFDIHAIDYLLKPFSRERFDKAIQKAIQNIAGNISSTAPAMPGMAVKSSRIVVKENGRIKIIPLAHVFYIESADDYVKIYTADKFFLKKQTLQHFEESLPPQDFIRVHRSYLVNTHLITRIDISERESHTLQLTTGASIPISKNGYSRLKSLLGI